MSAAQPTCTRVWPKLHLRSSNVWMPATLLLRVQDNKITSDLWVSLYTFSAVHANITFLLIFPISCASNFSSFSFFIFFSRKLKAGCWLERWSTRCVSGQPFSSSSSAQWGSSSQDTSTRCQNFHLLDRTKNTYSMLFRKSVFALLNCSEGHCTSHCPKQSWSLTWIRGELRLCFKCKMFNTKSITCSYSPSPVCEHLSCTWGFSPKYSSSLSYLKFF